MLMNIVAANEEPFGHLALGANRKNLAARIIKLIRIIRQQVEIQSVPRELRCIESSLACSDHDISRRQLTRGNSSRIDVHGNTGQASWKSSLPRYRRVGRQAIQTVNQIARERIRTNLGVVHRVAAANRRTRIISRLPGKTNAWLKVLRRGGYCLAVVTEAKINRKIMLDAKT